MVDCVKKKLFFIAGYYAREGNILGIMGMDFVLSLLSSRFSHILHVFSLSGKQASVVVAPRLPGTSDTR